MPHDRRTGRLFLAMMGMVGVAMSVGCLRATNLRTPAGTLPDLAPAGDLQPVPAGKGPGPSVPTTANAPASSVPNGAAAASRTAPDTTPDRAGPSASPPVATPTPGGEVPPAATDPAIPAASPAGDRTTPPAALPTPLLDAAIRRAQAVNRQHIESLRAADATPPAVHPADSPADQPPPTREPATAVAPKPDAADPEIVAPLPLAASPHADGPADAVAVPTFIPIDTGSLAVGPPPTVPTSPNLPTADRKPPAEPADRREDDARDDEPKPRPDVPDARPAVADAMPAPAVERTTLEIAALRLCSRVDGFGAFQPMDAEPLKAGQEALVYCEMTGLEYQALGDEFVSRLAAHLEIRSGADGSIVWEQALKTARDLCRRPRHDYYVSYRVRFPGNLEPGSYRLRLIQTDLIGNHATSREVPVTFVR